MKYYLILLLGFLSIGLSAQTVIEDSLTEAFTTENISFNSAGVNLSGTIFKPKHTIAGVVLVHGSGQEARMEKLASLLAKNGIAVITYDKRGVGKSEGVYVGPEVGTNNIDSSNLNLLALDASAATNTLLAHLPKKRLPMGLMGFSQAGWIIPMAAKENRKVNFMVIFSGPVVTTLEQLRFQFYTQGNSRFWDTHTQADAMEHMRNDPDRYQFAATDPRDMLAKLSVKGLWLFGGRDVQAPVQASIQNLDQIKALGKPYEYKLFPDFGHNTAFAKSQEPMEAAIKWIKELDGSMKRK